MQRDTAYQECNKLKQIVEENAIDQEYRSAGGVGMAGSNLAQHGLKQPLDSVTAGQMEIIMQNLAEKNSQLEKDLKIQIL